MLPPIVLDHVEGMSAGINGCRPALVTCGTNDAALVRGTCCAQIAMPNQRESKCQMEVEMSTERGCRYRLIRIRGSLFGLFCDGLTSLLLYWWFTGAKATKAILRQTYVIMLLRVIFLESSL